MKKLFLVFLILLCTFTCVTACNFTSNVANNLADATETTAKVEEMMSALSDNRISDAKALMHPEKRENSDMAIQQMISYISGRVTTNIEAKGINVSKSTGTGGSVHKNDVSYQLTLNNRDVIYLSVTYLTNSLGEGFSSFQLVLGVV